MTPCERCDGHLGAALDGELSDSHRGEFDAHLELCGTCTGILKNSVETKALLKWVFDHPSDRLPELSDDQVKAIVAAMRRESLDGGKPSDLLAA